MSTLRILFVDDQPDFKVLPAIKYLENKEVDFSYEILKSAVSAMRYIFRNADNIDLIVLDLGLPLYENDYSDYDKLEGLSIISQLLRENRKIPVIINSETDIPNEEKFLEAYRKNAKVEHVKELFDDWFLEFINNL